MFFIIRYLTFAGLALLTVTLAQAQQNSSSNAQSSNSVAAAAASASTPLNSQEELVNKITEKDKELEAKQNEITRIKNLSEQERRANQQRINILNSQILTLNNEKSTIASQLQGEETRNNQIAMLSISQNIIMSMHSAANGLFTSGTFGSAEALFHRSSSIWDNNDIRNGWDKVASYTRFVGPALTVGGYYLSKTNASPDFKNALVLAGSLSFVIGEGGRTFFGRNEKDLFVSLTNVDAPNDGYNRRKSFKYQRIIEHVALSRSAYDQISLRLKVYENNRKKSLELLEKLQPLIVEANRLSELQIHRRGEILFKENAKLAGDVLAMTERYSGAITANNYAVTDLKSTYEYLIKYFPSIELKFKEQIALLNNFNNQYIRLVEEPVISRLPEAQRQLARWREVNEKAESVVASVNNR